MSAFQEARNVIKGLVDGSVSVDLYMQGLLVNCGPD